VDGLLSPHKHHVPEGICGFFRTKRLLYYLKADIFPEITSFYTPQYYFDHTELSGLPVFAGYFPMKFSLILCGITADEYKEYFQYSFVQKLSFH
jgi:hypothetical protein